MNLASLQRNRRFRQPASIMAVNYMRFVLRCVIACVVVVGAVAGVLIVAPHYRQWRLLTQKRAQLERAIAAKEQDLARVKRRQLRFREDPEFVERVARQNRRVRPGEIIFIFDTPPDEEGDAEQ